MNRMGRYFFAHKNIKKKAKFVDLAVILHGNTKMHEFINSVNTKPHEKLPKTSDVQVPPLIER